jgi:hypothetical protein
MRAVALSLFACTVCTACATIDAPVANENYDPPTRAQTRARSGGGNAMDFVRHGEDPCADESANANRPAIDTVVRTEEGDDAPVPDDGSGCKVWSPGRFTYVTVRGAKAFTPSLVGAREIASFDRDGTLFRYGITGNHEAGEVRCGKLILAELTEDRIAARIEPGAVIATGAFDSRRYARAAPCSERQAAVGAFALMLLDEENARRSNEDAKGQRDAKERERFQQQPLRQQRNDTFGRSRN